MHWKAIVAQGTLLEDADIEEKWAAHIGYVRYGEACPEAWSTVWLLIIFESCMGMCVEMWYAVWVQTGREEQIKLICDRKLGKQNIYEECFLPKYEKPWKMNGVWIKKQKILFPGYLFFVTEEPTELHRALKSIPQFTKILGDREGPIPLYEEEVDFLEKHINKDKVFEISKGEYIGKKLIITEGPLKDLTGKVVYVDRHGRQAVLEVEFFGRITRMKVGLEILSKLTEEQFEKLKEDKLATYKTQNGMESLASGGGAAKDRVRTGENA